MSEQHEKAAAETMPRRFQCITLPNDSVVINGADFDNMTRELQSMRQQLVERGDGVDKSHAWNVVWNRCKEIDPKLADRAPSGLACVLSLINALNCRASSDR